MVWRRGYRARHALGTHRFDASVPYVEEAKRVEHGARLHLAHFQRRSGFLWDDKLQKQLGWNRDTNMCVDVRIKSPRRPLG